MMVIDMDYSMISFVSFLLAHKLIELMQHGLESAQHIRIGFVAVRRNQVEHGIDCELATAAERPLIAEETDSFGG